MCIKLIVIILLSTTILFWALKQSEKSALHKAARRAHKDVMELLVKHGADIKLRDKVHGCQLRFMLVHKRETIYVDVLTSCFSH